MNPRAAHAFASALLDPTVDAGRLFDPSSAMASNAGLDVHRNTVVASLVRALAEGFPSVEQLVGAEFFAAMAAEAVRAAPPRHPVLLAYGAGFADFLDAFPPVAHLPYLGDVARLDGLRRRAWHAPDVVALDADTLAAMPPDRAAAQRVGLHPSAAVAQSLHPSRSIWIAQNGGDTSAPDDWRGETTLVFRDADGVQVLALDDDTPLRALIDALRDAPPLLEILATPDASAPFARALALGLLVRADDAATDPLFDDFVPPCAAPPCPPPE